MICDAEVLAEVAAGYAFDELGEHPVRGGRVVLERSARLPVAMPLREAREARVAVVPLEWLERRVREAGRVEHHLLHGDHVLAFGGELGDVLGDATRGVDRALRR